MDYEIRIAGQSERVSLSRRAGKGDEFHFHFGRGTHAGTITVVRREPNRLVLSIGERIYVVQRLGGAPGRVVFLWNGEPVTAELSTHAETRVPGPELVTADELVVSHFPAKVVEVAVRAGARLRRGETLLVLEAMKMETHVAAPRDCTVVETFVKEGEMVARGTNLVRLRFA